MRLFRNAFVFVSFLLPFLVRADLPNSSYLYFMGGDQEMNLFGGRDLPSFQMEYRPIGFSYKIGNAIFQPVMGAGMTNLPTITVYAGGGYTQILPKNQYLSFAVAPSARVVGDLYSSQSRFELRISPEYGVVTPTEVRFGFQIPVFARISSSGVETSDIGISFLLGIPLGKPRNFNEDKNLRPLAWDF